MVEKIATTFGIARIVPRGDGYFAVYVPWRIPGGNFNPSLGTHYGTDTSEERCRKAIDIAVKLKQAAKAQGARDD